VGFAWNPWTNKRDRIGMSEAEANAKYSLLTHTHSGYAALSHNHDSRYYTESEVDSMFASIDLSGQAITALSLTLTGNDALSLQNTVWDDIRVPLSALKVDGTKPPVFSQMVDDAGGTSIGVYSYFFEDQGVVGNEQMVHFAVQMPHNWAHTNLHPHVHWFPPDTNAGVVRWGLEYSFQQIDSVFPDTTTIYANATSPGVALQHTLSEFTEIAPPSLDPGVSAMMICRLFRNSSNAGVDTYGSSAGLLEIDFHYEINSLGSRAEYSV